MATYDPLNPNIAAIFAPYMPDQMGSLFGYSNGLPFVGPSGSVPGGAADYWTSLLAGNISTPPPSTTSGGTTGGGTGGTTGGNGLTGAFGAGATTGPALPPGTVSPVSTLFSQIPTGLANSTTQSTTTPSGDVISGYRVDNGNTNINTNPGNMFLPTGSQWTPRAGYDIVYGVKNGTYGHFQIPSADVPNAMEKYGIGVMGSPLSVSQINYHNNPAGGPNQTQTPGTPPPTTPPVTPPGGSTPPVDPPGGGGSTPPPPPPPGPPTLPALDTKRQAYLTAIDNFIKSQPGKSYATVDDSLRRAFNLPGMAELQMNQQANPKIDPNNFIENPEGNAFIPGAAPPSGFKWYWTDPDGTTGPNPGNYGLVPNTSFFNDLPGNNIEDLQTLVDTYNNPSYANKYSPLRLTDLLGDWGKFLNFKPQGATGQRASLAPMESISQLSPFMQRSDLYQYFNQLLNSVSGRLGPNYAPNYSVFNDVNDPTKVTNYFNSVNDALGLANLPSLKDVLGGGTRQLGNDQFYQGKSLDFYSPQSAAPAFFQYLLGDFDGASGPNPQTYALRMKGAPDTRYAADQILQTLNNPDLANMFPSSQLSNINQNIFSTTMGVNGNPLWKVLDSYKFPGGAGGPSQFSQSGSDQISAGGAGGPELASNRWIPSLQDTITANQQQADMNRNTQTQATSLNALYPGGTGTVNLGNTPPPGGSTPTTTTPPGDKPDPFAGVNTPYNAGTSNRPPKFYSPYTLWS